LLDDLDPRIKIGGSTTRSYKILDERQFQEAGIRFGVRRRIYRGPILDPI
jgi:hypothetical protein